MFCLHHDLPTMHAPWLSHYKSSWSCMNWKLGSKHLDVMHGVIPHPATIFASRRWSGKHLYGTEGTWINCPTCFPLLNVGLTAILRRMDCFIFIWTCIAVLADHRQRSFSKLSWLQNKTHKKERSFCFAPMNMCLKRCLLSCMVGLTRLTTPRGWSAIRNTDPVGVEG